MSELQKRVEARIVATLKDPYGAGSDLYACGEYDGEWLEVNGNLDIPHLASDILFELGLE